MFPYMTLRSLDAARAALDDLFSSGEIDASDAPVICKRGDRWVIWLRG